MPSNLILIQGSVLFYLWGWLLWDCPNSFLNCPSRFLSCPSNFLSCLIIFLDCLSYVFFNLSLSIKLPFNFLYCLINHRFTVKVDFDKSSCVTFIIAVIFAIIPVSVWRILALIIIGKVRIWILWRLMHQGTLNMMFKGLAVLRCRGYPRV